jgi:putative inorganic carbon (HCO3(-)) transporter
MRGRSEPDPERESALAAAGDVYGIDDVYGTGGEYDNEGKKKTGNGYWASFRSGVRRFFLGKGIIARGVSRFCGGLSSAFRRGAASAFLRSYPESDRRVREGIAAKKAASGLGRRLSALRRRTAALIENSAFSRLCGAAHARLMLMRSRVFGAFLLSFGGYSAVVWLIRYYTQYGGALSYADLVCAAAAALAGLPLLGSELNLSQLLGRSDFFRSLMTGPVGVPPEELDRDGKGPSALAPAVGAGILLGLLTMFVPFRYLAAACAAVAVASAVFRYPEAGMGLIILAVPVSGLFPRPSIALCAVIGTVAAAYALKLLMGKRAPEFGVSEIFPAAFGLATLLSAFPLSGDSFRSALLSAAFVCVYFLAVCLIRSRPAVQVCLRAQVLASTVTAAAGIFLYVTGRAPSGWLDVSEFPEITSRLTVFFANPNMTGFYLALGFAPALSLMFGSGVRGQKLAGFLCASLILVADVLTWSRASWIGLAAGGVLFAVSADPLSLAALPPAAGLAALAAHLFPGTFGARLASVGSMSDSTNVYRSDVWKGAVDLVRRVWLTGVGAGGDAFREAYVVFAVQGAESAPHSHSIYLQLLIATGAAGLLTFICSVAVVLRKTGWAGIGQSDRRSSPAALAFAGGAVSALVSGIFDQVFYNYRLLCAFWLFLGLASAAAGTAARRDAAPAAHVSPESADLEVAIEN